MLSSLTEVCSISNIYKTQEQEDQPATVRSQFLACRRTSAASLLGHERKAARGNQQQHEASLVPTPDSHWASIFDISRRTLLATLAPRPISCRVSRPTTPPLYKVCFPIASRGGTVADRPMQGGKTRATTHNPSTTKIPNQGVRGRGSGYSKPPSPQRRLVFHPLIYFGSWALSYLCLLSILLYFPFCFTPSKVCRHHLTV